MNIQEATEIALKEMGLYEIPMDHESRRKVAARFFELCTCRGNREPPRQATLGDL